MTMTASKSTPARLNARPPTSPPGTAPARFRCGFFGAIAAIALLAPAATASAAPRAAKGPYVTAVTDRDATIRFELDTAAPAAVDLTATDAPDAGPGKALHAESREPSTLHEVHLSGLHAATRYAYAVRAGGAAVADGRFVTAPSADSGAPLTFLVYGDERTDDTSHASVVRAMLQTPSDFLVNTGDMVPSGGNAPEWQTFFDIERPLLHDRPILVSIGNHELLDDAAATNFARYFGFEDGSGPPRPYGTARMGSARFFFLNGLDDWANGPERRWLERALTDADGEAGVVWRFAVVHEGPWSAGPHGANRGMVDARVPELLAAHKVDLVFSGHDHIYERGDAGILKYVISGGGGAPLYRDIHPVASTRKVEATHHYVAIGTRGDALSLVAYRADGSVLDRCGFAKGGPWDCDASRTGAPPTGASPTGEVHPPDPGGSAQSTKASLASPAQAADAGTRACGCGAVGHGSSGLVPSAGVAALAGLLLIRGRRRR
jgi:hypothetical protein